MDAKDVQPGTRALSRTAMIEFVERGWSAGKRVPCTFCHRPSLSSRIPDALSHFTGRERSGSRHPVSRNFATGVGDNSAYLSSDNSATAAHLDCRDCHDVSLVSIPNHSRRWLDNTNPLPSGKRSRNPFGLRAVAAPKAYDDLCRSCHGGEDAFRAFTGKDPAGAKRLRLSSHDNGADLGANAIRDLDNTFLRTTTAANVAGKTQCTVCHDAHRSQNEHLFSDGHELDNTGEAETAIDEIRGCTKVCHFRGDRAGNYDRHGHGEKTNWQGISLGRDCTFCHDATKPHATRSDEYTDRFRLPKLDASWTQPSLFGNARKSICASCHGKKTLHETKKGTVGCLDCHDPHAKGSDNNVMMIPNTNRVNGSLVGVRGVGETKGSEVVYFWKSPKYPQGDNVFHFYTNEPYGASQTTSAGFCDQRACHGLGNKDGAFFIPLSDFMKSGKHGGGNQPPNGNCETCHGHDNENGSFGTTGGKGAGRRSSAEGGLCTYCHGNPPPSPDNTDGHSYAFDEALTPHGRHSSDYGIECRTCHSRYTDISTHNTNPRSYQDVNFADNVIRANARYDPSGLTCSGITCHSDGRSGPPNLLPRWILPPAPGNRSRLQCDGCHGGDPAAFPERPLATGGHRRHLSKGVECHSCHPATASQDCNLRISSDKGYELHVDGATNVSFPSSVGGSFNALSKDCNDVSCHAGNGTNWLDGLGPDVGQYFDRSIQRGGARNYDDNSSHPLAGLTDGTAGRYAFGAEFRTNCLECHYASGPYRVSDECIKCHFEGGKAPATNHGDGILQMSKVTSDTAAPVSPFPIASLSDYDAFCLQCHDAGKISLGGIFPSVDRGTVIDAYSFSNSRHRLLKGGRAPGCIVCHAAHGEGNAQLVRHDPANRMGAGGTPVRYGLFPKETLGSFPPAYGRSGTQYTRLLARIDNVAGPGEHSVFADAADQTGYCTRACHNPSYPKDRMILRDNATGNYILGENKRKQYVIGDAVYPKDTLDPYWHIHVNGEIIPTDDMVRWYATQAGVTGPGFFHYPDTPSSSPSSAGSEWNATKRTPLPFFPDFQDGDRDFTDGYRNAGRIVYRFTCATCHNPHGTADPNTRSGDAGYPDLRIRRTNNAICVRCHS
jgi:predicted CxxxxCH...CXXCH cytochrome family protein